MRQPYSVNFFFKTKKKEESRKWRSVKRAPIRKEKGQVIREDLVEGLKDLISQGQYGNWILVDVLKKYLEMKKGRKYNLWEIGNNLRILKNWGFVTNVRAKNEDNLSRKLWKLTNKEYKETMRRAFLLYIPVDLYETLRKAARYRKMFKGILVNQILEIALKSARWVYFFRKMETLEAEGLELMEKGELEEVDKIEQLMRDEITRLTLQKKRGAKSKKIIKLAKLKKKKKEIEQLPEQLPIPS